MISVKETLTCLDVIGIDIILVDRLTLLKHVGNTLLINSDLDTAVWILGMRASLVYPHVIFRGEIATVCIEL